MWLRCGECAPHLGGGELSMTHSVLTGALAAALSLATLPASAAVIFDLSPTNFTSYRTPDSGPGQGVSVTTSTIINGFSFFAALPNGGDVKFMIWDSTNNTLLFSETDSFAPSNTESWISTTPISFDLVAGDTYWFGVIADNYLNVGYIYPPPSYSTNGLTAIATGNSNYVGFDSPSFAGNAFTSIGLQLSAVPEPTTWAMMLLGFAGFGFVGYRTSRKGVSLAA
jgi:PEP-CTERM motif